MVPVETPLDRLPLFVKAGSIVPFQPVLQHVEENPVEELTLHVYPTPGAFTARLYDDAGDGWAFKNGEYWLGTLECVQDDQALRLTTEVSGAFIPSWTRWAVVVHGFRAAPQAVHADGSAVPFSFEEGVLRFRCPAGAAIEVLR